MEPGARGAGAKPSICPLCPRATTCWPSPPSGKGRSPPCPASLWNCDRACCGGCTLGSPYWASCWCPLWQCSALWPSRAVAGRRACTPRTRLRKETSDAHLLCPPAARRLRSRGRQRLSRQGILRFPPPRGNPPQRSPDSRRLPHLHAQPWFSRRKIRCFPLFCI